MDDASFIETGLGIVDTAKQNDITLRLLGAIAFRIHCRRFEDLHKSLGRIITDLDLIGYGGQKSKIDKLLTDLGYSKRPTSLAAAFSNREIYLDPQNRYVLDVFLDRLQMSHTIEFKKRLEMDYPTIPLAEMVLQKMQIVQLNEKDIKDLIVLLREHQLSETDRETINIRRIAKILSGDWGFYYTVTSNLKKVKTLLGKYDVLSEEDIRDVSEKIDRLLEEIEKEPKSLSWKLRAKVGTSKKWYREVERFE